MSKLSESHRLGINNNTIETINSIIDPLVDWVDIISDGTKWVAVGTQGATVRYATSTDLTTWTVGTVGAFDVLVDGLPNRICFDGSNFLLILSGNTLYSSPATRCFRSSNGTSWSSISIPAGYYRSIASNGSSVVAIHGDSGSAGAVYSTNSGSTWTSSSLPTLANLWQAVGSNGVNYVCVGNSNTAVYGNGVSWTTVTMPLNVNWQDVASNGTRYVAVNAGSGSGNNIAAYSTDSGATWATSTLPFTAIWNNISSNQLKFLASSAGPYYATSTDAITWKFYTTTTPSERVSPKGFDFNDTGNIFGGTIGTTSNKITLE